MPIRVRFVTSPRDLVSLAIRGAEMGFVFSHAEVIMPDGTYLGAHADGGVEARPAGYDAAYDPIETIAEIPATDAQVAAFHDFLLAQIGKPYDFQAIEDFALGVVHPVVDLRVEAWANPERWFCSELVLAALQHAGIVPSLQITARHVTPRDLYFALSSLTTLGPPVPAYRPQSPAAAALPV